MSRKNYIPSDKKVYKVLEDYREEQRQAGEELLSDSIPLTTIIKYQRDIISKKDVEIGQLKSEIDEKDYKILELDNSLMELENQLREKEAEKEKEIRILENRIEQIILECEKALGPNGNAKILRENIRLRDSNGQLNLRIQAVQKLASNCSKTSVYYRDLLRIHNICYKQNDLDTWIKEINEKEVD